VTDAQITKYISYAAAIIEQNQHINQPLQQTSCIQDLKKYDEKPFSANGNYAKSPHNRIY
jgi:hypothetical protein